MARLRWPRESRFVDPAYNVDVTGPGEFDVPDDATDQYLARGWVDPATQDTAAAGTDAADEVVVTADADGDVSDGGEYPEDLTSDEIDESFDAGSFLEEHWRTVTNTIESGGVDAHLEEIEQSEEERDEPRESVLAALDERRSRREW